MISEALFSKNEYCHNSIILFLIAIPLLRCRLDLVTLFIDSLSLVRSPILLWRRVDAGEEKDVGKGARRPEIPGDEADDANEHSEPNGPSLGGWILEDLAHCLRRGQCCIVSSQPVQHFCALTIYSQFFPLVYYHAHKCFDVKCLFHTSLSSGFLQIVFTFASEGRGFNNI